MASSGGGGGGSSYYAPPPAPVRTPTSTSTAASSSSTAPTASTTTSSQTLQNQLNALTAKLKTLVQQTKPEETPESKQQFTNDLSLGSKGDNVKSLQLFLIKEKSGPLADELAAVGATGNFGPLTKKALAEYQKEVGIRATGYFGPKTREYISSLTATSPEPAPKKTQEKNQVTSKFERNLTLESAGDDVKNLQLFLIAKAVGPIAKSLGDVGATGYFGPLTKSALAEYQKSVDIEPASGYFGPKTREYINSLHR